MGLATQLGQINLPFVAQAEIGHEVVNRVHLGRVSPCPLIQSDDCVSLGVRGDYRKITVRPSAEIHAGVIIIQFIAGIVRRNAISGFRCRV